MIDLKTAFSHKIGFGGASLSGAGGGYGFGNIEFDQAVGLVRLARERGILLFDTAPIYGFRQSERVLGEAVSKDREDFFITSKSGITWSDNKRVNLTNEPKVTIQMLEQSLRDLQSDYIDLYMVHWPDPRVDIRRSLEIIFKAKERGKVRYVGLANTNSDDLKKARELGPIDVAQSELNLFNKEVLSLFSEFQNGGTLFQSWGTLDKGILTKRVDKKREQAKNYDSSDCRKSAPWWKQSEVLAKLGKLEALWPILEQREISPLSFALGHNLNIKGVDQVLIGMKNEKQCDSVLSALENLPTAESIEEIMNDIDL